MTHSPEFLKIVNDAKSRVKEIDIEGYRKLRAAGVAHVLVDVREDNEWDAGHAAGAMHLGKGIIERDIETKVPKKDTRLVLYCGGGFRSALAADNLQKMGYIDAISLDGGWKAWQQVGPARGVKSNNDARCSFATLLNPLRSGQPGCISKSHHIAGRVGAAGEEGIRYSVGVLRGSARSGSVPRVDRRQKKGRERDHLAAAVHAANKQEHLVEDQPGESAGAGSPRAACRLRASNRWSAPNRMAAGKPRTTRWPVLKCQTICRRRSIATPGPKHSSLRWIAPIVMRFCGGYKQPSEPRRAPDALNNLSLCWPSMRNCIPSAFLCQKLPS